MPKYKSETFRRGKTKNEDYMAECFKLMGLPVETGDVFCFICGGFFTWGKDEYPKDCYRCGRPLQRNLWAMPDLLIPNYYQDMASAVIYINSEKYHRSKRKQRVHDRDQIEQFCGFKVPVFIIDNEEINNMRHANRCLLALGIKQAIDEPGLKLLAYKDEKELLP
jgi:hypothetical protein